MDQTIWRALIQVELFHQKMLAVIIVGHAFTFD